MVYYSRFYDLNKKIIKKINIYLDVYCNVVRIITIAFYIVIRNRI